MNPSSATDDRGSSPGGCPAPVPWSAPAVLVATCGGVGRVPVAPGTAGSVLGVPLALATGGAATWAAGPGSSPLVVAAIEAGLIAALVLAHVAACTRAAAQLRRGKDPGAIVYDEFVALPLVLLPVPPGARSLACLAVAFVLFRIFDIAKPVPCRRLERLPAGWGIMADDQAAAAWAAACLALARSCGLV